MLSEDFVIIGPEALLYNAICPLFSLCERLVINRVLDSRGLQFDDV